MANKHLNVERLDIKDESRTDVSISWQPNDELVPVAEVRSEAPTNRVGCPTPCTDCGKWLDEGTVPHRVGVPDPNVLPVAPMKNCMTGYFPEDEPEEPCPPCDDENIGDYSDDMCSEGMAELLTLHSSVDHLPAYGATGRTPHTIGLIHQQVTR